MAPSSSEINKIWKKIERLDSAEQKKLLEWHLQAREPIHSFAEIKRGDHLVKKDKLLRLVPYEHHFLCIANGDGKPKIIHYHNTIENAIKQMSPTCLKLGSAIEQLGEVKEMFLSDYIREEDLQAEGNEVARVVWPEELRRYPVDEVIEKAVERKGEKWYNLKKNNCETFAMWCLCGLEVSTQVTRAVQTLCEMGSTTIKAIRQAVQQVLKAGVDFAKCKIEFLDDILLALLPENVTQKVLLEQAGLAAGAVVSILAEIYTAYWDISDAKKKWDKGVLIKNRKEFIKAVIDSIVTAPFRAAGNIGGMLYGQIVIPIPILGGLFGAVACFFFGDLSANLLTEFGFTEWLAECIDDYAPHQKRE